MDGDESVRWMTYAELGQARGISTASATRLAFRRKWRRQHGNDGTARVAVPAGEDQPRSDKASDGMDDVMGDDRADIMRLVSALEVAVAAVRERAEMADQRADRADQALAGERRRADALRDRLEGLMGDLFTARATAEQAQAEAQAVRGEAEQLRLENGARRARGLLARLLAAWKNE